MTKWDCEMKLEKVSCSLGGLRMEPSVLIYRRKRFSFQVDDFRLTPAVWPRLVSFMCCPDSSSSEIV